MSEQGWCFWSDPDTGREDLIRHSKDGTNCRRVVVIDPEDRKQIQRLTSALCREAGITLPTITGTSAMQAALRSLIESPKPREVYEHFSPAFCGGVGSGTTHALCGKVWKTSADVTVVGKCPECVEIVASGWTS